MKCGGVVGCDIEKHATHFGALDRPHQAFDEHFADTVSLEIRGDAYGEDFRLIGGELADDEADHVVG
jgi:hypothetical protein